MYKIPKFQKSTIKSIDLVEGETIEMKIARIMHNKEPIKDGAPLIYTDRKDGVISAYNIRADRWEIAAEAMDIVAKNAAAKREERAKMKQDKADDKSKDRKPVTKGGDGGTESIQGTESSPKE